jgi:hypothetical protein
MFAAEWGTGQVFWSMLWFFLFVMWIWLIVAIFTDIFRSPDLSGWGKALWSIFIILVPFLGAFVYLIARGHKMTEHAMDYSRKQDEAFRTYVSDISTASATSDAEQLEKLAALRAQGAIDDAEYAQMKARVVHGQGTVSPA